MGAGVAAAAAAAAGFLVDWASFFSLSYAMHLSWTFWKVSGWGILRSSERSSESEMAHIVRRTQVSSKVRLLMSARRASSRILLTTCEEVCPWD